MLISIGQYYQYWSVLSVLVSIVSNDQKPVPARRDIGQNLEARSGLGSKKMLLGVPLLPDFNPMASAF